MVVVKVGRPTVTTTTDKAVKSAAYGFAAKPYIAPTYPVVIA
jgi:hypothetical protein